MVAHPERLGSVDAVLRLPQLHQELLQAGLGRICSQRLLLCCSQEALRSCLCLDKRVVVPVEELLLAIYVCLGSTTSLRVSGSTPAEMLFIITLPCM